MLENNEYTLIPKRQKYFVYVLGHNGRILNNCGFNAIDWKQIRAYITWAERYFLDWERVYGCYPTRTGTTYFFASKSSRSPYDWIPFKRWLEENANLIDEKCLSR